jgi:hypothetical protein
MAVNMSAVVTTPCSLVSGCQRFREICYLHLHLHVEFEAQNKGYTFLQSFGSHL